VGEQKLTIMSDQLNKDVHAGRISLDITRHLPYILLFAGSFVYFAFIADYICFYQEKLSLFVLSGYYLADHLKQPGLPLVWAGRFITSFFYYPALGGAIISLVICSAALLISGINRHLSGPGRNVVPILGALGIFFLSTDYHFLLYNSLGILFQLLAFYLLIRQLKGWLPVVAFPLIYFLTGSFAWLFFILYTLWVIAYSLRQSWYKPAALLLLALAMIYVSREYIFFQTGASLLLFPLSKADTGGQYIPLLALSGLISLVPLFSRITFACPLSPKVPAILRRSALILLFPALLTAIPLLRFDRKDYQFFRVEKLFFEGRYRDVTSYLEKNPSANRLTIYLNNISLSETGRLNDMLFRFRQDPEGKTLFLNWDMKSEVLRVGGYFYYTTGMINEAVRWAYENMVMEGLTPEGLKMLVKCELINGDYPVASKYVSLLGKTLFYRREADKYSRFLYNDSAVEADPDLGSRRRSKVTHDFFTLTGDPFANIEMALSSGSMNRRAFEYKLAYLLIKKDHKGITEALSKLPAYGFNRMPIHLEEAATVYGRIRSPEIAAGTLQVSKDTEIRFDGLMQIIKNYGNDPRAAEPYLRKQYAGTFWYWVFYR